MAELENRGIPSVGIATTEFVQAAEAQAKALGTDPAAADSDGDGVGDDCDPAPNDPNN